MVWFISAASCLTVWKNALYISSLFPSRRAKTLGNNFFFSIRFPWFAINILLRLTNWELFRCFLKNLGTTLNAQFTLIHPLHIIPPTDMWRTETRRTDLRPHPAVPGGVLGSAHHSHTHHWVPPKLTSEGVLDRLGATWRWFLHALVTHSMHTLLPLELQSGSWRCEWLIILQCNPVCLEETLFGAVRFWWYCLPQRIK